MNHIHQHDGTPNCRTAVAIAILHQGDRFLMQLRDDIPGILYPGHWAMFGGHIEPGEDPDTAVHRELLEEIGYAPPQLTLFRCYEDEKVIRHVYHSPLTVALSDLVLNEGWDMDWFTLSDIHRGDRYSQQAEAVRPLGSPHQRILLEFIDHSSSSPSQLYRALRANDA